MQQMLAQLNRSHLSWRPRVRSKELDIIVNGEFTSGTGNWSHTGSSTLTNPSTDAELGADPLHISNISSANVWNDKLIQTIGYEVGETYTVEFTARADSSHTIRVNMAAARFRAVQVIMC